MRGRAAPPHPRIYRVPPPPPASMTIWIKPSQASDICQTDAWEVTKQSFSDVFGRRDPRSAVSVILACEAPSKAPPKIDSRPLSQKIRLFCSLSLRERPVFCARVSVGDHETSVEDSGCSRRLRLESFEETFKL